jgi:hypothetical protein
MMLVLGHPSAGSDSSGAFLAGTGTTASGGALGSVKIHTDDICAVRTQRLEGARVAANVVVVPIVVVTMALAASYGADVSGVEFATDPKSDAWPQECGAPPAGESPPD